MKKLFGGIKKIIGFFLGMGFGVGANFIVKWTILLVGASILVSMEISGARAVANLEAVANIIGFIILILVWHKVYQLIVGKKEKIENVKEDKK